MKNLTIESIQCPAVYERPLEIVERKGRGHPDYICDAVMESVSVGLSQEYIKTAGRVLHFNIDKALLVAGEVEKKFGGGKVISPMELIIGDRATFEYNGVKIPVAEVTRSAASSWLTKNLPAVNIETDIKLTIAMKPGSPELTGIFDEKAGTNPTANDTSCAVGLAPFTPTEKAVFDLEHYINSQEFKETFPEMGSDVKIMGLRRGSALHLTVACPLFASMISGEKEYFNRKEVIYRAMLEFTKELPFTEVSLDYNCLDRRGLGEAGVYLALLGTSAEDGDSGEVGRGNTIRGVIAVNRPCSAEAAAGKNPVSHVGKIYSILAQLLAEEIYSAELSIKEVRIWLLSRIGAPLQNPEALYVEVLPEESGFHKKEASERINTILESGLASIDTLTEGLIRGDYPMC